MSRAYRISVSESVQKHIRVSDGIRTQLELLAVLGAQAMSELLAADLATRGFQRSRDQMVRDDDDGVQIAIGVAGDNAGHVTVRLTRDQNLDIEVERSRQIYIDEVDESAERAALKKQVDRTIAHRARAAEQQLSAEVTSLLERKLRDLRVELDSIANRVTAEALKVRAGQLGEIREISEDPETGSLTIKVRV